MGTRLLILLGFHTGFIEKRGKPAAAPTYQETVPITNVLTARMYTFRKKILGVFEQIHATVAT